MPKKRIVSAALAEPTPIQWEDDWDQLHGQEERIADADSGLAGELFESPAQAFEVGLHLGSHHPVPRRQTSNGRTGPSDYGPLYLYGREAPARRMLFLEGVAWLIVKLETFHTKAEAKEFTEEVTALRKEVWSPGKPWPHAAHSSQAFFRAVEQMADVFAHAESAEEANYPNRQKHPLG